MRRLILVLIAIATVAFADTAKDPYAAWRDPIARMVGASHDGAVLAQLTDLGDTVGGRVSGTPRYAKAVEWAVAQLKAAGAQNVHLESFTLPRGWQRGTIRGAITAPVSRTVRVESVGWSPSTPAGGVRAPVIAVTFDALPSVKDLKGKIALVDLSALPEGPRGADTIDKSFAALKDAGALAALVQGSVSNNVVSTGIFSPAGRLAPLPAAIIGLEDAKLVARQLSRGPVTLELAITNAVTGPIQVANVIGELRGRDKPDEWVLVGAHLDSWDFATGSQDNGVGVALIIQTARLLATAGPLRRTVRFALQSRTTRAASTAALSNHPRVARAPYA